MHEHGYCDGIVEAVVARAGDRQVTGVHLRAGVLHRIVPEALQQSFRHVAEGTVAQEAAVAVETVPVTLTCRGCGHVSHAEDPFARCSACDGVDVDPSGGDELTLVSVSLRREDVPTAS